MIEVQSALATEDVRPCGLAVTAGSPIRVQLSRRRGWRKPPNCVVVARPSRWGNPWRVGEYGSAAECVARYEQAIRDGRFDNPVDDLSQLHGKNLACWCSLDQPCHADVLLRLANIRSLP